MPSEMNTMQMAGPELKGGRAGRPVLARSTSPEVSAERFHWSDTGLSLNGKENQTHRLMAWPFDFT